MFVNVFVLVMVLWNVFWFLIKWFVVRIRRIGLFLFFVVCNVVSVIVGVVFCLMGFNKILLCFIFFLWSCLVIKNWCVLLYINIGGFVLVFLSWVIVFWSIVLLDISDKNCFGRVVWDFG